MKYEQGPAGAVYSPRWEYMNGAVLVFDGAASQEAVAPVTDPPTNIFVLWADGGNVYFDINNPIAGPGSPGYVADSSGATVGPLFVLTTVRAFSPTAGARAHIMWFRER